MNPYQLCIIVYCNCTVYCTADASPSDAWHLQRRRRRGRDDPGGPDGSLRLLRHHLRRIHPLLLAGGGRASDGVVLAHAQTAEEVKGQTPTRPIVLAAHQRRKRQEKDYDNVK